MVHGVASRDHPTYGQLEKPSGGDPDRRAYTSAVRCNKFAGQWVGIPESIVTISAGLKPSTEPPGVPE